MPLHWITLTQESPGWGLNLSCHRSSSSWDTYLLERPHVFAKDRGTFFGPESAALCGLFRWRPLHHQDYSIACCVTRENQTSKLLQFKWQLLSVTFCQENFGLWISFMGAHKMNWGAFIEWNTLEPLKRMRQSCIKMSVISSLFFYVVKWQKPAVEEHELFYSMFIT